MSQPPPATSSNQLVLIALAVIIVGYLVAATFHAPQHATDLIVAGGSHGAGHKNADPNNKDAVTKWGAHKEIHAHPPYWMVVPFALMLAAIAVLPLIPAAHHWWENNLHRFYVAGGLAAMTLAYYLLLHAAPLESHWPAAHQVLPSETGWNLALMLAVLANAILKEYIPFIVLLFSLYTISGGIRIEGDLPAHPLTNCGFLAAGAVLASFIGTTGAAMLLIRPLLETNRERRRVQHTVIFFIFIVCNCGGLLLPLGDPPLFLGYLLGVPFLWTTVLWKEWLLINASLLAIYYVWDRFWHYPHEQLADVTRDEQRTHRLRFGGIWPNAFLLGGVLLSIGVLGPTKAFPGTDWHPWLYLREVAQLLLVAVSLILGSHHVRRLNRFNYAAIIEVAALFFGIFVCMQPALQILNIEGPNLGLTKPWQYFWTTGLLSSVLDNAPTYVVFFETAKAFTAKVGLIPVVAGVGEDLLIAVSLGAVFMGANTYIGNGPNFMVKAIAEKSGVKMPGFFGYILYSGGILIPLFILTSFFFF